MVSPQAIVHSDFNVALSGRAQRHGYETLEEMFGVLAARVQREAPRSYIYAYWPQLDSLAHEFGIASSAVADAFTALDAGFAELVTVAGGSGSRIVVSADHGFVDTSPADTIDLDDHPRLRETLVLPLCGEPRVAYAYLRSGCAARRKDYMRAHLADRVRLVTRADVLRRGWLGPGTPHPALAGRLGDYVLIPRGRAILRGWLAGE